MLFDSFALDRRLLRAVAGAGWDEATNVQQEAIPLALDGRDVMACARTGSGKTAAFVLPTLQRLLTAGDRVGKGPRCLVLCPTRELAAQVHQQVIELGHYTRMSSVLIVGGEAYPPQIEALANGVDFVVGTPGRLIDHMQSNRLRLGEVEVLVLDEADRMLDMGFVDDVMRLSNACPTDRQTLFFSATLEGAVDDVAKRLVRDPARVEVDSMDAIHADIEEYVYRADNDGHKQGILAHLVRDPDLTQALVFVATKGKADEHALLLKMAGHDVVALHGDMPQSKRSKVVERLREQNIRIVVCTDVAARGLDIEGVSHVINFDLPRTPREYVHRIGRTGRAGAKGVAISIVVPGDWIKFADIEKFRGLNLQRLVIPGMEPTRPAPVGGSRDADAPSTGRRRYGRRGGLRSRASTTDDSKDE